jgi:hypothetical protein
MTGREGGAMRHGSGELLEDIRGLLPGHAPTETPGPELNVVGIRFLGRRI